MRCRARKRSYAIEMTGASTSTTTLSSGHVAIGRKNISSRAPTPAVERTAAIYSLVATAKLNDVAPQAYLRYVLERIAEHPTNRIDGASALERRAATADCAIRSQPDEQPTW
jgi:hypothetical protein